MTTTRRIIDITANLIPGYEAEETSEAKSIAYEILEWTYVPDSGDAITAADRVVEALIKAGWRPTVEEPAAEHHGEPNADAPTDAEVQAAASAMFDVADEQMRFPTGFDQAPEPLADTYRRMARAALVAAREVAGR